MKILSLKRNEDVGETCLLQLTRQKYLRSLGMVGHQTKMLLWNTGDGGGQLKVTGSKKVLGVVLDSLLNFKDHIQEKTIRQKQDVRH